LGISSQSRALRHSNTAKPSCPSSSAAARQFGIRNRRQPPPDPSRQRKFGNSLYPLLVGFNAVPKVAIVPVLVVWFGIGTVPAVLTAFLLSFFPIAVNVATGLATVEPELEDVLRSLGATQADIVLKVGLPRSLPYFFASLKIFITLAFVGAVIAETMASNEGIGMLIVQASSNLRIPLVFAALAVIAAMSVAMYAVFAVIEGRMTGWATRRVDVGIGG
jgi:NitT/TauT family transport system permease protein